VGFVPRVLCVCLELLVAVRVRARVYVCVCARCMDDGVLGAGLSIEGDVSSQTRIE